MPKLTDLLDKLDGVMASASLTVPIIPPKLIQCGVIARPGVSAIRMTQNILKDLAAAGFPITDNPDGTPNMTVSFVFNACAKGPVDEFTKNGVVQIPVQVGQATITIPGIFI
jgi:hypothetical protein